MKLFSLSIFSVLGFLCAPFGVAQELNLEKQRVQSEVAAERAINSIRQLFIGVSESDFSDSEAIGQTLKLGSLKLPKETAKVDALKRKIQIWIAQIDLAQDYSATKFGGRETLDQLIRGKDYFGVSISSDFEAFDKRHKLVKQLFDDSRLNLGDRLFGLMQTGKEDQKAAVEKWIAYMEVLSGPDYLGASFDKQPATLHRSLKALSILRGVNNSSKFKEAVKVSGLEVEYQRVLNEQLKVAAFNFAKTRYQGGGLLRDWSLPIGEVIIAMYNGETRDTIGITAQAEYQKYTLAHARALTELVDHFNAKTWSNQFVDRSLKTINDYRSKSFYIGSTEIREKGTLKVPQDQELELLVANAKLFGTDGHVNIQSYKQYSERLDKMFLGKEGQSNFDGLLSLKKPEQWLAFFDYELFGDRKNKNSVFQTIKSNHAISPKSIKVLFLARLILPSEDFQRSIPEGSLLEKDYEQLLVRLGMEVKETSTQEYRNFSNNWSKVQNGYMEISKGFPNYSFDRLNLTTSNDLEKVRRGFDQGMFGDESVAVMLNALFEPESRFLASSMEQMTSPIYRIRTGSFDMKLTPEFVDALNERVIDIIDYRTYGYAAIDSLERPDSKSGRIMSHFDVSDYRLPDGEQPNTVMHDLVCGPDGGFGGLGVLFVSDIKNYKERESVLDAIAAADNVKLGDALFKLALDVNRGDNYNDDDLGKAAKRWLTYFKQSQANAQFNTIPNVLLQAVRGTYLSRLVFQSDSFKRALANSSSAPVGSNADISHQFEIVVSAQIRKMQAMLSRIDPETAANRNLEDTQQGWRDVKVWYVESVKWLEVILDDPLMASELSRIRTLNRKVVAYESLAPEVVIFQKNLLHFGGEVYSDPRIPFPVGVAKFGIEEILKLEDELSSPLLVERKETAEENLSDRQEEFGKSVSRQFLNEIRSIVRAHGFVEFSKAESESELNNAVRSAVLNEKSTVNPVSLNERAKAIKVAFEAAISRAISRIEAEQPSDMRDLHFQMIRASKVDKFISKDLPASQRIDIAPSLVLAKRIESDRIETLANFRTREISAEARQMVNDARAEKQSMEDLRLELEDARDESELKVAQLERWAKGSDQEISVDDIMDDFLAMRKELSEMKKENLLLADSEAIVRAKAADLAQQVMQLKNGGKIAAAQSTAQTTSSQEYYEPKKPATTSTWKPPAQKTYYKPPSKPSYSSGGSSQSNRQPQSSSSSNRTFFQRLFKRKQR